MNSYCRCVFTTAASAIAMLAALPAAAQDRDGEDNAEDGVIVVTAQKRSERVQDVPISVTVASQKDLERQQVNTVADLARIAPSLEIQQAPGQSVGGGGQIRGIGTQSFNQGAVGSVGIVVDGVSQGNANISDLFDVERVEVLKGPQGTLFGLTTSAGVINITTTAPAFNEFSFRGRTEVSSAGNFGSDFGRQVIQGVMNVPLGDTAAMRVSGNGNFTQGVNRNAFTGELDKHRSYGFRGRLLWEPSPDLTVNLIADWTKVDDDGLDFFVIDRASPVVTEEALSCGVVVGPGNRDYCTDAVPFTKSTVWGTSLSVDYDLGPIMLTSISSYRDTANRSSLNIFRLDTHSPRILAGPAEVPNDGRLFTQELRIASPTGSMVEYTAGVFYSYQKTKNPPSPFQIRVTTPVGFIFPVNSPGNFVDVTDESYAAFGQATIHATDQLRFIVGGRYTHETLGVDFTSFDGSVTSNPSTEIDNFSWRLGTQYEFNRNLMAYATVSRGYKGPQIALGDPTDPAAPPPTIVRAEIPTTYELGLKATVFDGGLLVDLNGFYTDLKDYQGQLCITLEAGGLQCVPTNISGLVSKGLELSAFGNVSDNLTLSFGAIWSQVQYPDGFAGQDGSDLSGEQLVGAPEFKVTLSGEYSQPVSDALEAFLALDSVYKSDIRFYPSTDPRSTYGGHVTLGGRVGVRSSDGRWTGAIFVRNLTNNHEPVYRLLNFPDGTGGTGQILTAQSFRQVGASVDFRF